MLRWAKQLETWHKAGLLSTEQVAQIHQFEASQPRRAWGVWGLLGIGATAIATGVVSVIAANWENLGDAFKLGAYFFLQGLLGWLFYRRRDRSGPVRELLLTLFALLILGGIGLIGQIYNLSSEGWQGLLLWLALALPATALAEGRLLPHVWTLGAGLTACIWAGESHNALAETDRWLIVEGLPMIFAGLAAAQPSHIKLPARLRSAFALWGFLGLCVGGSLFANIALAENWLRGEGGTTVGASFLSFCALLSTVVVGINRDFSRGVKLALVAIFASVTIGTTLPFLATDFPPSARLGALAFLAIWSAAATAALLLERRRWFDLATVVIAARFIVIYFEMFGTLAATGFGLILSGGVIIAVALLWHRARARLRIWWEAQR